MSDDVPLEEAVHQVKQILVQTIAGKLQWKVSDLPGAFVAERSTTSAMLDRIRGVSRREMIIRLRFSP